MCRGTKASVNNFEAASLSLSIQMGCILLSVKRVDGSIILISKDHRGR